MEENKKDFKTIDEYIMQFPADVKVRLQEIRKVIKESAPQATEKISWGMPTFYLHGNLVHFAAHKKHIGLYPGVSAMERFKEELSEYNTSKGAIQLPLEKPIRYELISEIVQFRVNENINAADNKSKEKQIRNK